MSEKTKWYKYCGADEWALGREKFKYLGLQSGERVHINSGEGLHIFQSDGGEYYITGVGPENSGIWKPVGEKKMFSAVRIGTVFKYGGRVGMKVSHRSMFYRDEKCYQPEIPWDTMVEVIEAFSWEEAFASVLECIEKVKV